jgi:hypothetical protein
MVEDMRKMRNEGHVLRVQIGYEPTTLLCGVLYVVLGLFVVDL